MRTVATLYRDSSRSEKREEVRVRALEEILRLAEGFTPAFTGRTPTLFLNEIREGRLKYMDKEKSLE